MIKILIALLLAVPVNVYARSAVVFQPSAGANYALYWSDTHSTTVLQGTMSMGNAIVGDVDGDSAEDDLVYRNSSGGGLGYYEMPADGAWHPENVHVIPNCHLDAVPLTVVKVGGWGTSGQVVYTSSSAGQSFAVSLNGTVTPLGCQMDRASAVDAQVRGYRGDLLWQVNGQATCWREGVNGSDHSAPYLDWTPLGGGQVIPNQRDKTIAFYATSTYSIYVCDKNWAFTRIDGTNGDWGPSYGWPVLIGDADDDWLEGSVPADLQSIPITIKSSTTPYTGTAASGINFATQADFDQAAIDQTTQQVKKNLEDSYLRSYLYTPVDIRSACNRSYLNSPFGSDPGNSPLKFADLSPGVREVYNIPFTVVDDSANAGKSMVMAGPEAGAWGVTVPVNQKADCLFFFGNCAGWASNGSAEYVVNYTDGTQQTIPLRNGYEIGDWMGGSAMFCPARVNGSNGVGGSYIIYLYAIPTDGSKTVASVEVKKSGQIAPMIFAITLGRLSGVPLPSDVAAARQADIDRIMSGFGSPHMLPNTDAGYTLTARSKEGAQVFTYGPAEPP